MLLRSLYSASRSQHRQITAQNSPEAQGYISLVAEKRAQNTLEATGKMFKWPVGLPDPATTFWSYLGDLALNSMMTVVIFSYDPPVMGRDRD